jgi:hypothetical protein
MNTHAYISAQLEHHQEFPKTTPNLEHFGKIKIIGLQQLSILTSNLSGVFICQPKDRTA